MRHCVAMSNNIKNLETIIAWNANEDERGVKKMKRTMIVIKTKTNLLLNNNVYNNHFSTRAKKGFYASEVGAKKANEHFNIIQCNQFTTQLWFMNKCKMQKYLFKIFRSSYEQNEQ